MSGITCGAGMGMAMGSSSPSSNEQETNNSANTNNPSPATMALKMTSQPHPYHHNQGSDVLSAAQQHAQILHKSRSDDFLHKAQVFGTARTASTEATSFGGVPSSSSSSGSIRSSSHHADHDSAASDGMMNRPPRYGTNNNNNNSNILSNSSSHHNNHGIPVSRSNDSYAAQSRASHKSQSSSSLYKPTKQYSGKRGGTSSSHEYDHDHHTYATAMTASATISYSTDEVEHVHSDVSEAGMEVVMDDNSAEELGLMKPPHKKNEPPYVSHSFPAGKHTFTVDQRYSFLRVIGSGAYGVVISAKDNTITTTNENDVAIKMVPKAFHDEIDAKRILREIKLLKHFRHENIVSLMDMMPPSVQYVEDYHDVYMVTDLMETDLHRIIYSKQKLSLDHVQYFVYQVLRGLKYIHSCNVLHRDLKPSNLLVNSNCDLKICDFGLARGIYDNGSLEGPNGSLLLTEYVVTRWYRAPEIMLACHEYSKPIDVWSVGCIFAELILRKPYFPGDDYIDQLTIISEKLGKLPESDLDFVTSDKAKRFMRKLPNKTPVPLAQQFPSASPEALDLLRKMLSVHPKKRITVEDALAHPFFRQLHSPEDEPVCDHGSFDFSFEKEHLHRKRLQELIWREVGDFRPSVLPVKPSRASMTLGGGGSRGNSSSNLELSVSRSRSNRSRDP